MLLYATYRVWDSDPTYTTLPSPFFSEPGTGREKQKVRKDKGAADRAVDWRGRRDNFVTVDKAVGRLTTHSTLDLSPDPRKADLG